MQADMAFRTEALPTHLCNNHKRTEPLNRSENVAVYAKRSMQRIRSVMKASLLKIQPVRVAVVESDPLRFVGLRTCLGSESDFELSSTSLSEAGSLQNIDLVLLGNHIGSNLFEVVATLKAAR